MPTTGPFSRIFSSKTRYRYQKWYRQGLPRVAPLFYDMELRTSKPWSNALGQSGPGSADAASFVTVESSPAYTAAYNRAYEKFKESVLGEAASLAVNIAERKQVIDMMTSRVSQIYRFARAVRSFRFGEAATILGLQVITQSRNTVRVKRPEAVKRSIWRNAQRRANRRDTSPPDPADPVGLKRLKKKRRLLDDDTVELRFKRRASAFGSNYLEFHFGWEPLMKDIGASIDVFNDPIFAKLGVKCKGGATHKVVVPRPNVSNFSFATSYNWDSRVTIRGNAVISDPNLYKANQLGLLNPAVVLWELVPFSFIVDWFSTFGDYLQSLTDFVGLSLSNLSTTHYLEASWTDYYNWYGTYHKCETKESVCVRRVIGTSGPIIALKPFKWPSVTRGLTAVSLLTQFLKRV